MLSQYRLLFPFELISKDSKILIYGAGKTGQHYIEQILMTKYCNIEGIIDKNHEDYQSFIVPVYPPSKIPSLSFDYIVIAMQTQTYNREIIKKLKELGVQENKIIYMGMRRNVDYKTYDDDNTEAIFERDFSLESGERSIAKSIDEVRRDHVLRYNMAARYLQEIFAPPQSTIGIDCFCGTGYGSLIITEKCPNASIIGIDASTEAVEFGNKYFYNDRAYLTHKKWPFKLPNEMFDFAVSFESIEHIPDGKFMIESIIDSLKPGGVFIFSTPNENIHSLRLNPDYFHCKHWTKSEINDILHNKMKIIKIYGQDVFDFENGIKCGLKSPEEMNLIEDLDGAVLVYVCQKELP